MYKYCPSPFTYAKNYTKCVKSLQFYVIVVGVIGFGIILIAIGLTTYFKRKKVFKNDSESKKLIFSKKDPVYKGY